jgi:4-carboxymuconolactone decarboxylase
MADIDDTRPAQNWLDGRRERGIRAYARIFKGTEQEVPAAMAARVGPLFAEEAFAAAGGPAWSHPALTPRDRSIAVITALAAQGVTGERLDTHLQLAIHNGLDHDALAALMTLLAIYIGYAHASAAMESVEIVTGTTRSPAGPDPAT